VSSIARIIDEIDEDFKDVLKEMDAISADCKLAENYLKTINFIEGFSYQISTCENIYWDNYKQRLMYINHDVNPPSASRRPVIETKIEIRKKAHGHLGDFLRAIKNHHR